MKIVLPLLSLWVLTAVSAGQDRTVEFEQKFRTARDVNSKEEMVKLVRQYQKEVVNLVVRKCELIPSGTSGPTNEADIAALRTTWQEAFQGNFVGKYYEYCSIVDAATWKERNRLVQSYTAGYRKYEELLTAKDPGKAAILAGEFGTMAVGFQQAGDMFYAGRSWGLVGDLSDQDRGGENADLYRACASYKLCVECCEVLELTDGWAVSVKERYSYLESTGYGAPPPAPDAPVAGAPVATEGAAALVATMQFEALPELEAYERPSYFADDVYQIWPFVQTREKGTSGNFGTIGNKPVILRLGSSELSLDVDGDQKGDMNVPTKGNRTLVQFKLGTGEEEREWAFITEIGIQDDNFQGMRYNLSPSDEVFNLFYMNAGSVVGTLNGVKVRVIDDNMDGLYGSEVKTWNWGGLPEGVSAPEIDAVVVGDGKRARPWSEFQEVGGQWYKLAPAKAGMALSATPVTLETGKLALEYTGEMPAFVIVRGRDQLANSYFDLLQNGRAPIDVPIGNYELCYGIVRKGKKAQTIKALMLSGPRLQPWSVTAGQTTKVTLGGPFGFDFIFETGEEKLTVKGKTVKVTGAAGEQYVRLWGCVPRAEISWRKAGTKRGSKPEDLDVVGDIYEKDEQGYFKYGQDDTFMNVDTSVDAKLKDGERAEVQLVDKKNKLFKVIESIWK